MTKHGDEWRAVAESVYELLSADLDNLAWMNSPPNDDFELAILELTSRDVRLTGKVFEEFLKLWHGHQVVIDNCNKDISHDLDICFKEKTVSMTRNLLKKDRQGLTPLNLREVVRPVCVNTENLSVIANGIRKRVVEPMGELMVWDVSHEARDVKGDLQPREWSIGVGPALFWFQKLVYVPLRGRQIRDFMQKHGGGMR